MDDRRRRPAGRDREGENEEEEAEEEAEEEEDEDGGEWNNVCLTRVREGLIVSACGWPVTVFDYSLPLVRR